MCVGRALSLTHQSLRLTVCAQAIADAHEGSYDRERFFVSAYIHESNWNGSAVSFIIGKIR